MQSYNKITQAVPAPLFEDNSRYGKRVFSSAPQLKDNLSSEIFTEFKSFNYQSNFAEEERQRRLAELQKKQETFTKKREAKVLQEAGRWQAANDEYKRSLEKIEVKRTIMKAGQKNVPSEPFNVITLDYDSNEHGEHLKKKDLDKQFRDGVRMFNLDAKRNSGYNIITGAARSPPRVIRYA